MTAKLSLDQVNALSPAEFRETFYNVIELCPAAANFCSHMLPFSSVNTMIHSFHEYLSGLDTESKIGVIQGHPDLAGRLLATHQLTQESSFEHSCAGLDQLSIENAIQLNDFNNRYKNKFNFPFVICVRQARKIDVILSAVMARIHNSLEDEVDIGIEEVKKICELRILELVDGQSDSI